jgi:hypothetical protein
MAVRVAIQYAGQRGKCPGCAKVIQVPAAPPPPEEATYAILEEEPAPTRGPSLPLDLARRGWKPHKFNDSNVVVFLPATVAAAFGPDGVLYGSTTGKSAEFSATLHGGFEEDPAMALDFVAHLAEKRGIELEEVGTSSSTTQSMRHRMRYRRGSGWWESPVRSW